MEREKGSDALIYISLKVEILLLTTEIPGIEP